MCRAPRTIREAGELGDALRRSRGIRIPRYLSVYRCREVCGSFGKIHTAIGGCTEMHPLRRRISDFVPELQILLDRASEKDGRAR